MIQSKFLLRNGASFKWDQVAQVLIWLSSETISHLRMSYFISVSSVKTFVGSGGTMTVQAQGTMMLWDLGVGDCGLLIFSFLFVFVKVSAETCNTFSWDWMWVKIRESLWENVMNSTKSFSLKPYRGYFFSAWLLIFTTLSGSLNILWHAWPSGLFWSTSGFWGFEREAGGRQGDHTDLSRETRPGIETANKSLSSENW